MCAVSTNEPKSIEPWITRALPRDADAVTRWFQVTTMAYVDGVLTLLLRCVLGWDASELPAWVSDSGEGRVATHVETLQHVAPSEVLHRLSQSRRGSAGAETRRIEVPVFDWYDRLFGAMWNLRIPLVMYELWSSNEAHETARTTWMTLTDEERRASGLGPRRLGYLGSTVLLLPQARPYFASFHHLVLPDGAAPWGDLGIVSEVRDGAVTISRSAERLRVEPWREMPPSEAARCFTVHHPARSFAAINNLDTELPGAAIAYFPREAHGRSASDWRIAVVGSDVAACAEVGVIRGIGTRYFTSEPWRFRSPALGFSAPADVTYVPRTSEASESAFARLLRVGGPASICDRYAEPNSLDRIAELLRGGRLLTHEDRLRPDRITEAWAHARGVSVKVADRVHDRFVVGSRRGFLVGSSLNGLGRNHSFLVELDATMQQLVEDVFDSLWNTARDAW